MSNIGIFVFDTIFGPVLAAQKASIPDFPCVPSKMSSDLDSSPDFTTSNRPAAKLYPPAQSRFLVCQT